MDVWMDRWTEEQKDGQRKAEGTKSFFQNKRKYKNYKSATSPVTLFLRDECMQTNKSELKRCLNTETLKYNMEGFRTPGSRWRSVQSLSFTFFFQHRLTKVSTCEDRCALFEVCIKLNITLISWRVAQRGSNRSWIIHSMTESSELNDTLNSNEKTFNTRSIVENVMSWFDHQYLLICVTLLLPAALCVFTLNIYNEKYYQLISDWKDVRTLCSEIRLLRCNLKSRFLQFYMLVMMFHL